MNNRRAIAGSSFFYLKKGENTVRKKLKKFHKNRFHQFSATVNKINKHSILLVKVRGEDDQIIANHVWIPKNKRNMIVEEGNTLQFSAIVVPYTKLDWDGCSFITDYGFAHIRNYQIIKKGGVTHAKNKSSANKSTNKQV